jgi:hypothetical protein
MARRGQQVQVGIFFSRYRAAPEEETKRRWASRPFSAFLFLVLDKGGEGKGCFFFLKKKERKKEKHELHICLTW